MQLLTSSLQLMLVITKDWNNVEGQLYRFDRPSLDDSWEPLGEPIRINVGKNGMALDPNCQDIVFSGPILKREGDGRSPVGIFSLGAVFGHAPQETLSYLKMPYLKISSDLECVDDPSSRYYNRFVRSSEVEDKDWNSSEKIQEIGAVYEWGIVVEYNTRPIVKGNGSCIFMHILKDFGKGTGGCTAMKKEEIEKLLFWLDSSKHPQLVQLPLEIYIQVLEKWQLPNVITQLETIQ